MDKNREMSAYEFNKQKEVKFLASLLDKGMNREVYKFTQENLNDIINLATIESDELVRLREENQLLQSKILNYIHILESSRVHSFFKANNINFGLLEEFIFSYKKHFNIKTDYSGKIDI